MGAGHLGVGVGLQVRGRWESCQPTVDAQHAGTPCSLKDGVIAEVTPSMVRQQGAREAPSKREPDQTQRNSDKVNLSGAIVASTIGRFQRGCSWRYGLRFRRSGYARCRFRRACKGVPTWGRRKGRVAVAAGAGWCASARPFGPWRGILEYRGAVHRERSCCSEGEQEYECSYDQETQRSN